MAGSCFCSWPSQLQVSPVWKSFTDNFTFIFYPGKTENTHRATGSHIFLQCFYKSTFIELWELWGGKFLRLVKVNFYICDCHNVINMTRLNSRNIKWWLLINVRCQAKKWSTLYWTSHWSISWSFCQWQLLCIVACQRKNVRKIYTLSPDSLSRQAFYGDADGVSSREYKCQTRLIWIRRKTGERRGRGKI